MLSLPWIHGCDGLKSRQFLVTIPSTKSRLFQEAWPQGNFNMEAVGFPFPRTTLKRCAKILNLTFIPATLNCDFALSPCQLGTGFNKVICLQDPNSTWMPHDAACRNVCTLPAWRIALGSFFAAAKITSWSSEMETSSHLMDSRMHSFSVH